MSIQANSHRGSTTKRAEDLLLRVSASLTALNQQAQQIQERSAGKVKQATNALPDIVAQRPWETGAPLAAKAVVPLLVSRGFIEKNKEDALTKAIDLMSGVSMTKNVDLPNTQLTGTKDLAQTEFGQLTTILQIFQEVARNLEAMIQRIQQTHTNSRAGG